MEVIASERRDRAQLILIGAIAIAFIVLGIVVVFNSVLYTQTISSGNSIESTTHADHTERELDRGVRGLMQRVNADSNTTNYTDFESAYAGDNVSAYLDQHQNATSESRSAIVALEDVEIKENATVARDRNVSNKTTVALTARSEQNVGEMTLTVDRDNLSSDIEIGVNASGLITENVTISENGSDITIENSTTGECTITDPEDPVRLDFVTGEVNASSDGNCPHGVIDRGDSYDTIDIDPGSSSEVIEYILIAKGSDPITVSDTVFTRDEEITAAWSIAATYSYESNDVSFERDIEIEIYGDDS